MEETSELYKIHIYHNADGYAFVTCFALEQDDKTLHKGIVKGNARGVVWSYNYAILKIAKIIHIKFPGITDFLLVFRKFDQVYVDESLGGISRAKSLYGHNYELKFE